MRLPFHLPLSSGAHEIEVAALVGLQNGFVEQVGVAALRPIRRRQLQRRTAPLKLGVIDQQVDAAPSDIEPNHVAILDQRQRTADR